jgi:hypothetical protein
MKNNQIGYLAGLIIIVLSVIITPIGHAYACGGAAEGKAPVTEGK